MPIKLLFFPHTKWCVKKVVRFKYKTIYIIKSHIWQSGRTRESNTHLLVAKNATRHFKHCIMLPDFFYSYHPLQLQYLIKTFLLRILSRCVFGCRSEFTSRFYVSVLLVLIHFVSCSPLNEVNVPLKCLQVAQKQIKEEPQLLFNLPACSPLFASPF